jgi:hypothetical protein
VKPETPYTDTEVLLAVLRGDEERAIHLLIDMTDTERKALQDAASEVERLAWSFCGGCRTPIRRGQSDVCVGPLGGPLKRYHEGCRP